MVSDAVERGPFVSRSKADFRVMRESLGLSQAQVARLVGVSRQTVVAWEDPGEFYPPRREAWDLVEGLWARADARARAIVEMAVSAARVARERGVEPAPLLLSYWRCKADFRRAGNAGDWPSENAAVRMAADRLAVLGVPCSVAYAEVDA
ncbi:hypothetical protein Uis1B_2179 [Bifidobacterium margollesii]|uniref:HTH cro/C1-type domain-containing protein n=1 Tax=Bifidobacterium margollesii TaxID=2020964 RepID=A0A2N5J735_9BIFI|nr:helix-turn-helix domain-containing protein [Bifidobacterium margollesii]PLS29997.1 hypothetical protein Uis1B_2179 [Bifidobacterium margollesii]